MLQEFLQEHRADLIARCREKVRERSLPGTSARELSFGITVFLDQLIQTLGAEQVSDFLESRKVSGPASGVVAASEIGETASRHGREMLQHGFNVEDVIHDYGDLCQAITDLAFERSAQIGTDEFRTFNRCLDNATAIAVTEFGYLREQAMRDENHKTLNEMLGAFAHELRNSLATATLALSAIRLGRVGLTGATGAVLDRSLVAMRNLIDRSLVEAQMAAGPVVETSSFSLAEFIGEIKLAASLEAEVRGRHLIVAAVDPKLAVSGDRSLLAGAVGNLLHNAFKFSAPRGEVSLNAYASGDRVLIDVEDSCGGLPAGDAENLFKPFTQADADRTGAGLGLSISRKSVEANGGLLTVRDIPGTGCVFTIDLPRQLQPEALQTTGTTPHQLVTE
ncbi:MAG: HAMP domain-containing histidine kinase [Pseudomonadota bacterium]|nr:HAMP domain-containing histidine kinase [Pseudomonadota bacterium]